MKKPFAILLTVIFVISSVFCILAYADTDYSWLDDMTINQLKELDKEIHKRIPYEKQESTTDSSTLPGTWHTVLWGIDCFVVLHEDGSCVLVTSNGNVEKGTYTANDSIVTISSDYLNILAGTWELSGNQLINSLVQVAAVKTDKPVRFSTSMGGSSMTVTISTDDLLLAEYREPNDLKRFDIVTVNYPERENTLFIKRIVGLPGDTVELRDGWLYVNDVKYDEPYVSDEYRTGRLNTFGPYTVPDGRYFVMGDHRNNSNDSRSVGPLPADMILGVIVEINGIPYQNPLD